jgi:hypothetical protein
MAGMATHYETNADNTQYTFFLRGHPSPRGTALPNTDSLPDEFSHGEHAHRLRHRPAGAMAGWSRRTTSFFHGAGCSIRKRHRPTPYTFAPFKTCARWTTSPFQVDLKYSTPYLLKILWQPFLAPLRSDDVSPGWDRRSFVSNVRSRSRNGGPTRTSV